MVQSCGVGMNLFLSIESFSGALVSWHMLTAAHYQEVSSTLPSSEIHKRNEYILIMSGLKSTHGRYTLQTHYDGSLKSISSGRSGVHFFGTKTNPQKLQHGSYIHRTKNVLCATVDVSSYSLYAFKQLGRLTSRCVLYCFQMGQWDQRQLFPHPFFFRLFLL